MANRTSTCNYSCSLTAFKGWGSFEKKASTRTAKFALKFCTTVKINTKRPFPEFTAQSGELREESVSKKNSCGKL